MEKGKRLPDKAMAMMATVLTKYMHCRGSLKNSQTWQTAQ